MTCQVLTLQLIKGVPSPYSLGAPATDPYDPQPLVIDFLTGVWKVKDNSGVAAYDPGIAGLKNGGVNVDSPLLDNILPIAGPVGVVTDGLTITSSSDESSKTAAQSEIMNTIRAASAFFFDTAQSDPVYLKVRLKGDAAPRYALVYDVQVDDIGDMLASEPHEIVLTFIREAYWRAIAPGANPKLYAFEQRELVPGVDYDYQNLALTAFGGTAVLQNWREETIGNAATFSAVNSQVENFIDINAANIPGDAPALLSAVIDTSGSSMTGLRLYVARNSKPFVLSGTPQAARMSHNGGDATISGSLPAGVTVSYQGAATGIRCDPPGAPVEGNYELQIAYPAGAITAGFTLISWGRVKLKNAGRYMAFVRSRITSGSAANMPMVLRLGSQSVDFTPVNLGGSTHALCYVGNFDLTNELAEANPDGTGAFTESLYRLSIESATRAASSAVTMRLADVILIPYDECALQAILFSVLAANFGVVIDNTGYFTRGREAINALQLNQSTSPVEIRRLLTTGQFISVEPRKDNRLYFLIGDDEEAEAGLTTEFVRVRLNIVPRWRHLRDRV